MDAVRSVSTQENGVVNCYFLYIGMYLYLFIIHITRVLRFFIDSPSG